MEEQTKSLLTSILDALLAHDKSGRCSVSWDCIPQGTFNFSARGEDGMLLFDFSIGSHLLNELHSRLNAEATDAEKPST